MFNLSIYNETRLPNYLGSCEMLFPTRLRYFSLREHKSAENLFMPLSCTDKAFKRENFINGDKSTMLLTLRFIDSRLMKSGERF